MKKEIGKIVANGDYPDVGLEDEHEYDSEISQELKRIFCRWGWAREVFSDSRPRKIEQYSEKSFSKDMFAIKNNCTYAAKVDTSNTWVRSEWYLVSGTEDYVVGQNYLLGNEVYNLGAIYKANINTSDTWVTSEWDLKIQGA